MEKMRCKAFEHLVGLIPEQEVVELAIRQIKQAIFDLRQNGIECDMPKFIIMNEKEYPTNGI